MTSRAPTQLSLPVHLPDDETFRSYYPAGNQQLIDSLRQAAAGEGETVTYLWGSGKSGRTHLLHATCVYASELDRPTFYLPLGIHASMSPAILDGLEDLALVCLDDIDEVCRHPIWEEALFNLYNRVREKGTCRLVVSARAPANQAGFLLPDLVSRLNWGIHYQLHPLSDDAKLAALQRRAKMRGLDLEEEVGRFLMTRLARDLRTLFEVLDRLDKASMVAQRRLTIPFVKEILHL
ncbi:DnaA inactivator Hda [Ferrimonas balearica]|uniref:DnaA inactivator Hda n=1 Tax=Ferrimonas balearica TaxID=44012 RepID=UPI001C96FA29|nr:DnaA inactivator Hda [Ferrimonas balearica]MBY5979122.1 DnaA inactivator Hda [Ferrimonas balearica]MBY6018449.1 DnaA inactivator Hda [Halomonas denitrificans]MBY6094801.1 DnaA inactivator Hda [Ferrimonas balearica]